MELKDIKTILEVLILIKGVYDLMVKSVTNVSGKRLQNVISCKDVTSLANDVFGDNLLEGQVVTVEGIISKYSHFYSPRASFNILPGESTWQPNPSPDTEIIFVRDEGTQGDILIPAGLESIYNQGIHDNSKNSPENILKLRTPYLPINSLPPYPDKRDGKTNNYRIYFLYPSTSCGLTALPPLSSNSEYYIPESIRGIPVLVPQDVDLQGYSESTCQLKAVIRKTTQNILNLLSNVPLKLRRELSSNFYRPSSATCS